MRSKLLFLIVLILTITALPGIVQAEQLVAMSEYTLQSVRVADPWEQGLWFTTGSIAPEVALLGFIDVDEDGLDEAHTVNLWLNSDNSLVASVEIPAGVAANLVDGYRWVAISGGSIILAADTEYTVSSDTTGITDEWYDMESVSLDPYFIGSNDNTTYGASWAASGNNPGANVTEFCYGLVNLSSSIYPVSNPTPADGASLAPGTITLKWEHSGTGTDDVFWNAGSNDVNSLNFQWHIDTASGKVIQIGFAVGDPNEVTGVSIVAEKDYRWRVDNAGEAGPVWNFTTINQAPTVDAGLKQALWLAFGGGSVTFQLAPTVTDDPLPQPHVLTYSWVKTAGSGAVTFSPNSTTKDATASMSVVDDYQLELTVSDGDESGSDTVKLRVHANDTTGLEARYDCEEGDAALGLHDDYSGWPRNPNPPTNTSRRAERMDIIGEAGITATEMLEKGGNHTQPEQDPADTFKGGINFNGFGGHLYASNSYADPNWQGPTWADFRDEVTLAAWIKPAIDGGWTTAWETIISKGYNSTSDDGAYALWRNNEGDGLQMAVYGANNWASGTIPVNDGEWHHVVGTYDGARVCVYVDAIEDVCVETDGGQIHRVGTPLTFGETYERTDSIDALGNDVVTFSSYSPFKGRMDEIRIHSIGLPHASDNPELPPLDGNNARSIRSIYRTSSGHVSCGGNYLAGDANEDCYVNLDDAKTMAQAWLECNSVSEARCDANTDKP